MTLCASVYSSYSWKLGTSNKIEENFNNLLKENPDDLILQLGINLDKKKLYSRNENKAVFAKNLMGYMNRVAWDAFPYERNAAELCGYY